MIEHGVLVIDVPAATPPDEAGAILSEPLTRGYYLRAVNPGEPMRAVFATYAADSKSKCDDELRAMDVVVSHREETATRIVQRLCELGIHRSTAWVTRTQEEL